MIRGAAHVQGLYNYPDDGNQFANGCDSIWNREQRLLKVYLTGDYLTNYPKQNSWSSVPTNLTQLAQTTQFATQLARNWHTVVLTTFTFANGGTNWWRTNPSAAKMQAEYDEIYNLAVHLLTTYNGTGRRFVLQNWEGDWAFMDAFVADTYVPEYQIARYAAFLGKRQAAVAAARAATSSDCTIQMAVEVNRVLDSRLYPHRRRILTDLAKRITPDVISYSAYDSTIVDQGSWGASYYAWRTATVPAFTRALRAIKAAFPNTPIQVGEFGYPENEIPYGIDYIANMIQDTNDVALSEGVQNFIFWQVFDNEVGGGGPGTYRGYWFVKPDGTLSVSGQRFAYMGPGDV
jgi:hypothetical protein